MQWRKFKVGKDDLLLLLLSSVVNMSLENDMFMLLRFSVVNSSLKLRHVYVVSMQCRNVKVGKDDLCLLLLFSVVHLSLENDMFMLLRFSVVNISLEKVTSLCCDFSVC